MQQDTFKIRQQTTEAITAINNIDNKLAPLFAQYATRLEKLLDQSKNEEISFFEQTVVLADICKEIIVKASMNVTEKMLTLIEKGIEHDPTGILKLFSVASNIIINCLNYIIPEERIRSKYTGAFVGLRKKILQCEELIDPNGHFQLVKTWDDELMRLKSIYSNTERPLQAFHLAIQLARMAILLTTKLQTVAMAFAAKHGIKALNHGLKQIPSHKIKGIDKVQQTCIELDKFIKLALLNPITMLAKLGFDSAKLLATLGENHEKGTKQAKEPRIR